MKQAQINKLVFRLCRQHHTRIHTVMSTIGLYRGQPPVLFALQERDGRTQSEIAAALRIQPATMTNMLQSMEAAGFIERRADPDDARVSRVFLTQNGRDIIATVLELELTVGRELLQGFSESEQEQVGHLLLRLIENLERVNEQEMPV